MGIISIVKFASIMTQILAWRKVILEKHTIITHTHPHLDERFAIIKLREVNPLLKVEFWTNRNATPDGRSPKEWEADGYLLLGVAGGELDEHASTEKVRSEDESATSLTLKSLGLHNRPELKKLVDYIVRTDTKGGADPFSIHTIINHMGMDRLETSDPFIQIWTKMACEAIIFQEQKRIEAEIDTSDKKDPEFRVYKAEKREAAQRLWNKVFESWLTETISGKNFREMPELSQIMKFSQVVNGGNITPFSLPDIAGAIAEKEDEYMATAWLLVGINIKYQEQKSFWDSVSEFKKRGKFFKKDRKTVVVIKSDNPSMAKIARSKEGGYCAIAIVMKSNGNVAIMSNKFQRIGLAKVITELRRQEHNINNDKISVEELESENFRGIWYYLIAGEMVFNGSNTTVVEPTKLSLNRIKDIVLEHFTVK